MAEGMTYDDVIDPRELRNALISGLDLADARLASSGQPEADAKG
jgi:hypothetical protein